MRALTYNIRGMRDDYPALVRVINEVEPDVVLAQEAPTLFRPRARAADLARRCRLVVVDGGYAAGNLMLISVGLRVHRVRNLLLPKRPGWHQRGAVLAELSRSGQRFVAVGTHLSLDAGERAEQAELLLAAMAEFAGESGAAQPVERMLLAGDLNERPGSAVCACLGRRLVDGAVAAGRDGGGTTDGATFATYAPDRRIDYLWTDPGTEIRSYRVIDSPDARQGSDHFPAYAELALR